MQIDREALFQRLSGSLYARSREDGRDPLFEHQADEYARDTLAVIEPILARAEAAKGMRTTLDNIYKGELRQGNPSLNAECARQRLERRFLPDCATYGEASS